jgi:DNA mismatch repair protein MutL
LIPDDSFPSYFIYFEVDPTSIDVNIHPTKTEINFIDFKSIYAILHAAVRQSIGQFSLTPTIDFNVEQSLNIPPPDPNRPPKQPVIQANPNYNPFNRREEHPLSQPSRPTTNHSGFGSKWQEFYAPVNRPDSLPFFPSEPTDQESSRKMHPETGFPAEMKSIQIRDSFIVTSTRSAIVILDQQHAHERILYEKYLDRSKDEFAPGQLQLIPQTLNLGPGDAELLKDWISHFKNLGFEIGEFGKDTFLVRSAPAGINPAETTGLLESILESLKSEVPDSPGNHEQLLAKAMARKMAVKRGQKLHQEECDAIVGNLFACKVPEISPEGKPTMMQLPFDDLGKKMKI